MTVTSRRPSFLLLHSRLRPPHYDIRIEPHPLCLSCRRLLRAGTSSIRKALNDSRHVTWIQAALLVPRICCQIALYRGALVVTASRCMEATKSHGSPAPYALVRRVPFIICKRHPDAFPHHSNGRASTSSSTIIMYGPENMASPLSAAASWFPLFVDCQLVFFACRLLPVCFVC